MYIYTSQQVSISHALLRNAGYHVYRNYIGRLLKFTITFFTIVVALPSRTRS